ncbi:hypothetical protein KQI65_11725 [bacterium]|nr:hypothetical protein [bacterium]
MRKTNAMKLSYRNRTLLALFLLCVIAVSVMLLPVRQSATLPAVDDLSMYLVMLDRFEDGDPANNNANGISDARNPLAVQGGDLRGVEQRLPYLDSLGVNALWITPVQQNIPGAFHGYWIQHFKRIDPRLGSMEDLRRLINRAHARGMRVYLDVVCNHTAPLIGTKEGGWKWNDDGYTLAWNDSSRMPTPKALQDLSLYHNYGEIPRYEFPYQVLGELPGGLDDFRTEDPRVLAIMIDIWTWWMEQTGCDGFRVDTVKHVDLPFWYAWLEAIRRNARSRGKRDFFVFGEVFSTSDSLCAVYTQPDADGHPGFDAVYNFSLAEGLRDALGRNLGTFRLRLAFDDLSLYHTDARSKLLNFIDNHDMDRFLSLPDATPERLTHALTFLYGLEGIPLLYYGTEQGFSGGTGKDWKNRESMFAGGWKGTAPAGDCFQTGGRLYRHIAALNRLRARYPVLRRGSMHRYAGALPEELLVAERRLQLQRAYVLLNAGPRKLTVTLPTEQAMMAWGDLPFRQQDDSVTVELAAFGTGILLPRAAAR